MKTDTVTPSSLDDVLLSADVCYAEGDQTGAIEALDQAAKLSKRHPVILRALGTQLFLNGRHTWSRTVFEELTCPMSYMTISTLPVIFFAMLALQLN